MISIVERCLEPNASEYSFMEGRWFCSLGKNHDGSHLALVGHDPMQGIAWLGPWKDGSQGYREAS